MFWGRFVAGGLDRAELCDFEAGIGAVRELGAPPQPPKRLIKRMTTMRSRTMESA